jgi:hypothetical protein
MCVREQAERALSEYAYFIADAAAISSEHFTNAVKVTRDMFTGPSLLSSLTFAGESTLSNYT